MRQVWWTRAVTAMAVAGLVPAAAGCTVVVPGTAAAPPQPGESAVVIPETPPEVPDTGRQPPQSAPPRGGLLGDVLDDECLLNAAEFAGLVGVPVRRPEYGPVVRDDGSRGVSCVANAGSEPVAMINVYAVRGGTPADYVRAGGSTGRRQLSGLGEAAVIVDTAAGPTLQLASPKYLVTILVSGRTPADAAWTAAARTALSRLPG